MKIIIYVCLLIYEELNLRGEECNVAKGTILSNALLNIIKI